MGDVRPAPLALAPVTGSLTAVQRVTASETPGAALAPRSLKILHILRAPLGGLFRHVVDLAHGQSELGHRVGLVVDSMTGGARAETALTALAPKLALGFQRIPMARQLSMRDIHTLHRVSQRIKTIAPDVLHGHGAKGAALARLTPHAGNAIRVYTPHGGSLIYNPGTLSGNFYRGLEWLLNWRTDLFLFESSYVANLFRTEVDQPRGMIRVVRNGVGESEFAPLATKFDATDIVCVGELRPVKAIDLLIEAIAALKRSGRKVTATIAGEGPEGVKLKAQAERHGLADQVHFIGHCPARKAFTLGRTFVIPSRAESLPYVVLEAAAAGMPIIATRVGGISEIFGPQAGHLIAPDNLTALIDAISKTLDDPEQARRTADTVRARVRDEFSVNAMVEGGLAAYREAIAMQKLAQLT
jgi:glycosyltransferase involved in cell wall biosynthesis